jgi:hypothetical protein
VESGSLGRSQLLAPSAISDRTLADQEAPKIRDSQRSEAKLFLAPSKHHVPPCNTWGSLLVSTASLNPRTNARASHGTVADASLTDRTVTTIATSRAMAPVSSKGKGKQAPRDPRRSRSRNTTPVSATSLSMAPEFASTSSSPYLHTNLTLSTSLSDTAVEDILNGGGTSSNPPSASTLRAIAELVKTQLLNVAQARGETCEKLIRELAVKKKERAERDRQREAEREAEERRRKLKKATPKKRDREEDRPLAVGAHGLARQDGVDVHKGTV